MNAPTTNGSPKPDDKRLAYSRLETDQEFVERLRQLGHERVTAVAHTKRDGETDDGFFLRTRFTGEDFLAWHRRVNMTNSYKIANLFREELDDKVWEALKLQRKIIWVTK